MKNLNLILDEKPSEESIFRMLTTISDYKKSTRIVGHKEFRKVKRMSREDVIQSILDMNRN